MREFYSKALVALLCLLALSAFLGYVCIAKSYIHLPLLPFDQSGLKWHLSITSDAVQGGDTTIKLKESPSIIGVDFNVSPKAEHPYAAVELFFDDDSGKSTLVDLTAYNSISFNVTCTPANILTLGMLTFDEKISKREDFLTYRGPSTFFSCSEHWGRVERDLSRLEIPQWWFDMFKFDLSSQAYQLDKVPKITVGTTTQSPVGVSSSVQLDGITLNGRNWHYVYLWCATMVLVWGGYAIWFFKRLTYVLAVELMDKIQRDRPLVAYQQLSLEPHKDKEKSAILRYIATEYANPNLDMEAMVEAIGVNRNKINDTLKSELGFTFTAYLNKLRLTEAARLLRDTSDASVAEIAYSVGYNNVSYFNKLFKEEYGCTPKTFKSLTEHNTKQQEE